MTITRTFENFAAEPIHIGFHGESKVTGINIDLNGVIVSGQAAVLLLRRSGESAVYEKSGTLTGGVLSIIFNETDGAVEGWGEATVMITGDNDYKRKSATARTVVEHALISNGTPPTPPSNYRTKSEQDAIDNTKLSDAPADGKTYGRKDGTWSEVAGGGGGMDIHGQTVENAIADADELAFYDSSASGNRKTTWQNIKAKLKAYFDTLYTWANIKPYGGVAKSELASGVQSSLDKADSALQEHQSLAGYATQAWVEAKGYITSLAGYATQAWVQAQGYLTEHQSLADYSTTSQMNTAIAAHHDSTKQNVISDLATIRSGAALGATALQEHQSLAAYRTSAAQDTIDSAIIADVSDIEALIPAAATAQNQLADKSFVNSSVATNTAYYISNNGQPFTSVAQLEAYSGTVTNNDYAFVTGQDGSGNTYFDRYKATVVGASVTWAKEYRLNNSSFTAAQWAAITSGITSEKVLTYDGYAATITNKVDKVTGKGLSSEDYTSAEKTKLSGIAAGAEVNVQSNWTQTNTGADDYIKNKPALAAVATSGSYNDLSNKPTIPAAQVNSDWNASSGVAQILNKPSIPSDAGDIAYDGTETYASGTVGAELTAQKGDIAQLDSDKLDISQGVAHAGDFVVVGNDGNITTMTLQVWQGGSY